MLSFLVTLKAGHESNTPPLQQCIHCYRNCNDQTLYQTRLVFWPDHLFRAHDRIKLGFRNIAKLDGFLF